MATYHIVVGCGAQNGDTPTIPLSVVDQELKPNTARIKDEITNKGHILNTRFL